MAIVTLCSFVTWKLLGTDDLDPISATVSSLIVTFLIVFFGEVIPKVYADKKKLTFALLMAKPLAFLNTLFLPVSATLRYITGYLERKVGKRGFDVSMDELHKALEMTPAKTSPEEKEILKGIVNFGTIAVSFWSHSGLMLGQCGDHLGVILGSCWGNVGVMLGSCWSLLLSGQCQIVMQGLVGVMSGSCQGQVKCRGLWDYFKLCNLSPRL